MDAEPGTDTPQSPAPGTLERFHLGLAVDGTSCAMVFVDECHRSIACIASFADLDGFIVSLMRAATEMARRRALLPQQGAVDDDAGACAAASQFYVTSSDFRLCGDDGAILGALTGEGGQVIPIRMRPDVANEMTRNILRTVQATSRC